MEASDAAREIESTEPSSVIMLHIVGTNPLQTELLVEFMAAELEVSCRSARIQDLTVVLNQYPDRLHLAFLDCHGGKPSVLYKSSELNRISRHPQCRLILYNVGSADCIEMDALKHDIRGILYRHQPIDFFPRAARAVLNGELWYPRKALAQFMVEKEDHPAVAGEAFVILTRREREIVKKLAEGRSNREIARHFCISPHTVRTHVYNIYKKINVENRLQASLWLANCS